MEHINKFTEIICANKASSFIKQYNLFSNAWNITWKPFELQAAEVVEQVEELG